MPETSKKKEMPVSLLMAVTIVFISHGFVNSLLLMPWNSLRCAYWNIKSCTETQDWIMNNLAFGHFSVFTLLACLAKSSMGDIVLERRIALLVSTILLSNLSSGIYILKYANKSMVALQCAIYVALLAALVWNLATEIPVTPIPPGKLKSSSFDHRKRLPIPTVAIAFNFVMSFFRVVDLTFGSGREIHSSSAIFQIISETATNQTLWITLILGTSIVLATPVQHRTMLVGYTILSFLYIAMMASSYGSKIDPTQLKSSMLGTFLSMMISLIGCY